MPTTTEVTAVQVARLWMHEVYRHHSLCENITSDRDGVRVM